MTLTAGDEIDALIAKHPDWRGARLADIRKVILEVDSGIVETWKWMGSPVWELDGILCVGNIFKNKVSIVFQYGASLDDPEGLFNTQLGGNQRRGIDWFEGDEIKVDEFKAIVRRAIERNNAKPAKK